ncbi:hypothetical protein XaC1_249 [Xanthomonas phage XaC1]|nr:hypothetical protein XaC1_249 [Xanthomonas phage XaC1]
MIKVIFLVAAFSGHSTSTTTTMTQMPDMETCKKAEQVLYDFKQERKSTWSGAYQLDVQAPIKTKCVEL